MIEKNSTNDAMFTVDVEDGVSIGMRDFFGKKFEPTGRVETNTLKMLDILAKSDTKGTFFILGQVAKYYPHLIKDIYSRGHEIGVHGDNHIEFQKLTPKTAFEELSNAKSRIEDLIGFEVIGHRAPAFSINPKTFWALEIIRDAGFKYDSSVMPIKTLKYGWKDFDKQICKVDLQNGREIIEIPMTCSDFMGLEFPVGGGSYLRLFPYFMSHYLLNKEAKKKEIILYVHPYELDTQKYPDYFFQELNLVPLKKRLLIRSNWLFRGNVSRKVQKILNSFNFITVTELLNQKHLL